jgi:hypothetical protein
MKSDTRQVIGDALPRAAMTVTKLAEVASLVEEDPDPGSKVASLLSITALAATVMSPAKRRR